MQGNHSLRVPAVDSGIAGQVIVISQLMRDFRTVCMSING